jgi:hypothetical protein
LFGEDAVLLVWSGRQRRSLTHPQHLDRGRLAPVRGDELVDVRVFGLLDPLAALGELGHQLVGNTGDFPLRDRAVTAGPGVPTPPERGGKQVVQYARV